MSTYELDDDLVEEFLGTLHESEDELPSGKLGGALKSQLPIPVPTKIGAVVRNSQGEMFLRWSTNHAEPWIVVGQHDHVWGTSHMGRISEVLSEGVDL